MTLLAYSNLAPPKIPRYLTDPNLFPRALTQGRTVYDDSGPVRFDSNNGLYYFTVADDEVIVWDKSTAVSPNYETFRVRTLIRPWHGTVKRAGLHFGDRYNTGTNITMSVLLYTNNNELLVQNGSTNVDTKSISLSDGVWYFLDVFYTPARVRVKVWPLSDGEENEPDWLSDVAIFDYGNFDNIMYTDAAGSTSARTEFGPIAVTTGEAPTLLGGDPYPLVPVTETQIFYPLESWDLLTAIQNMPSLYPRALSGTANGSYSKPGTYLEVQQQSFSSKMGIAAAESVSREVVDGVIEIWGRMQIPASAAANVPLGVMLGGFGTPGWSYAMNRTLHSIVGGIWLRTDGTVEPLVRPHSYGTTGFSNEIGSPIASLGFGDVVEILFKYDPSDGSSEVTVWESGTTQPASPQVTLASWPLSGDAIPATNLFGWAAPGDGDAVCKFGNIGIGFGGNPAPRSTVESVISIQVPTADLPDTGGGPEEVTGLRYALWDTPTPDTIEQVPVKTGTTKIGSDGVLTIDTGGTMGVGQWGYLVVTDSTGDDSEAKAIAAPVQAKDPATVGAAFSGGEITIEGGYVYHRFTEPGSHTLTPLDGSVSDVDRLVIGGGGGGGSQQAGGGGAGEYVLSTALTISSAESVTVGAGGAGGAGGGPGGDGESSSAAAVTAIGGGGGGGRASDNIGSDGGSGGGGANSAAGGTGTATNGNDGGAASGAGGDVGGGGGGAGAAGAAGTGTTTTGAGGDGGDGAEITEFAAVLSGTSGWVAAGGGGGCYASGSTPGVGGQGGGGDAANQDNQDSGFPTAGADGTGSGGGASSHPHRQGARGGNGAVYYRYPEPT